MWCGHTWLLRNLPLMLAMTERSMAMSCGLDGGLGFGVCGLGFGVCGLGFGVLREEACG